MLFDKIFDLPKETSFILKETSFLLKETFLLKFLLLFPFLNPKDESMLLFINNPLLLIKILTFVLCFVFALFFLFSFLCFVGSLSILSLFFLLLLNFFFLV